MRPTLLTIALMLLAGCIWQVGEPINTPENSPEPSDTGLELPDEGVALPEQPSDASEPEPATTNPAPYVIEIGNTSEYMVIGREEWMPYRDAIRCWANGTLCDAFGSRYGRPVWRTGYKPNGVQWLRFEGFGVVEEIQVGGAE